VIGENAVSNERLEFLGDAVLGLAVGSELFRRLPLASEGELTQLKARFVNNAHLFKAAHSLDLGSFLCLGKGEEKSGGRKKPRMLADALEAVLGAVYLDGGMEAASGVAERCILVGQPAIDHRGKTALQEWLQARGRALPEYVIVAEDGPSYRRTYEVEVRCGECVARGRASRKKHAEQHAASLVLERLVASEVGASERPAEAASQVRL
jgi:ribonuclease-3